MAWEETESDFLVFYRVDDPYVLPGPVFAARLRQLVHYQGAVRGRALAESARAQEGLPGDGRPLRSSGGLDAAAVGQPADLYRPSHGYAPVIEVGK